MNYVTKFSHLGSRWGGQVTLLPRVVISRNLMICILLMALMLFILFPAAAQDATPTPDIIVTAVPTIAPDVIPSVPVVVPAGSTVDTAIVFALLALVAILGLGGTALVGYAMRRLGDSVPADKVQEIVDSAQKWAWQQAQMAAARTPQTWDDMLVNAGAGVFGYNPAVGTPTRPPTTPRPLPPTPTTPPFNAPLPQPLGVPLNSDYDLRRTTFTEIPKGEKRIAVPTGYAHYSVGGDTAVHTDAFYDPDQGFKMMLDSRGKLNEHGQGAQYGYEALHPVELYPGTRYTIAPRFDAKISGGAVNIRAALIENDTVLFELPAQRIEPGTYADQSVVFVFQLSATKSVFHLRLRVYVETEYATLRDDSYIRWRQLPLEAQAPDYGNDAVVRY